MPGCHCVSDQRVLNSDSEQARQRYITGRFSSLFLLLLVVATTTLSFQATFLVQPNTFFLSASLSCSVL